MRSRFVKFGVARVTQNFSIVDIMDKFWLFFYRNRMVCYKFLSCTALGTYTAKLFQNCVSPLFILFSSARVIKTTSYAFSPFKITQARAKTVCFTAVRWPKKFLAKFAFVLRPDSIFAFDWGRFANFQFGKIFHMALLTTFCTGIFFVPAFTIVSHFRVLPNNWVNSGKPVTDYAVGNPEPSLVSNHFEGAQTKDDPIDGSITYVVIPVKENNSYKRPARKGRDSRSPIERWDNLENYICIASINAVRGIKDHTDFTDAAKYGDPERLFSGECGRIYGCRVIEESNYLSNSRGGSTYGEAIVFGRDAVMEAVALPEEIRAKIPTDYGRSKGVAWYGILGFAKIWDYTADSECHIIHVNGV